MRTLVTATVLLGLSACSQGAPLTDASSEAATVVEATDTPAATEPAVEPVGATSPSPAAAEASGPDVLTPEGLGAIIVGQEPPSKLKLDGAQVSDACQTFSDKRRRIYAMVEDKVVQRITAMSGSPVRTARGVAVGATEAAVRKAYPDAAAQPHKYVDAPAKYLDWRPGGGASGLRFEIDASGKVSAIHAGREPQIEYVEGCA